MDELKIPEDLKDIYKEAQMNTECEGTFNDGFVAELIERIAKLQTERDALLVALKEAKGWTTNPVVLINTLAHQECLDMHAKVDAAILQTKSH